PQVHHRHRSRRSGADEPRRRRGRALRGASDGGRGDHRVTDDPGVEDHAGRRGRARERRGAAHRDPRRPAAGGERDVPALRASDARRGDRARLSGAGRRWWLRARPSDGGLRHRGTRDPHLGRLRRARCRAPRRGRRGAAQVLDCVVAAVALAFRRASPAVPNRPPAARNDLAPTGTLRAGINYGNFILATKDAATGESRGVAIDLTRELAQRLAVAVELTAYTSVAAMVDAAKNAP